MLWRVIIIIRVVLLQTPVRDEEVHNRVLHAVVAIHLLRDDRHKGSIIVRGLTICLGSALFIDVCTSSTSSSTSSSNNTSCKRWRPTSIRAHELDFEEASEVLGLILEVDELGDISMPL